ncbi:unnamed protein product [Prorocentrum cordatum]|uniref:RNA helicase n=1 Tax=Prorocentrum cordatum TaxID=2364126 RepID=A0ABN9PP01_9DINO|nr:unnamed protein product [Polarella glacialis]
MGMSAPAEGGAELLQRAGDGAAPAGRAAVALGARPARAMDPPAAAVAGSVLAMGLVPCSPRALLAAAAAGRARASEPEVEPHRQDSPPQKAASAARHLRSGAPAGRRWSSSRCCSREPDRGEPAARGRRRGGGAPGRRELGRRGHGRRGLSQVEGAAAEGDR